MSTCGTVRNSLSLFFLFGFVIFEGFFGGAGIIVTKYVYPKVKICKDIDKTIVYMYSKFLH